ncbi:hypothetical protein [Streptomyces europaeiscabiei]|uniref:hypothetical protein n=1 Tax=Streptomyces europaeiscabiei TaxID=146819 RepID=UPI0029AB780C|nr:hypothetical protein [Streptomyces europaeiscabiei]MDX3838983.1 hypothetical protein [Streptomyces europaeiscabiei]
MRIWIRAIRSNVTVNVHHSAPHSVEGDPWGGDRQTILWALVAAILGGVASGAAEKAAGVLLGS